LSAQPDLPLIGFNFIKEEIAFVSHALLMDQGCIYIYFVVKHVAWTAESISLQTINLADVHLGKEQVMLISLQIDVTSKSAIYHVFYENYHSFQVDSSFADNLILSNHHEFSPLSIDCIRKYAMYVSSI